ncbi:hypothetical protein [uncultured Thiodictyon sp.]|uniref:hypothetical protein n=1 Tax=uncultured Thiodictyon sp. TaxID=1846217 RepID=UPI0025EA40D3|nr:hypothetical protein [uncultured Thiodictyon sp.]
MKRSLPVLPLAIFLAAGYPTLSLAEDTAAECRKMAAEEEVAPEDMEDYIAECLAVVQSETPEEAVTAMDKADAGAPGGAPATPQPAPTAAAKPTPTATPTPGAKPAPTAAPTPGAKPAPAAAPTPAAKPAPAVKP